MPIASMPKTTEAKEDALIEWPLRSGGAEGCVRVHVEACPEEARRRVAAAATHRISMPLDHMYTEKRSSAAS